MTNFEYAVHRTLDSEGVFSDDKLDRGGVTKYGITETTLRRTMPDVPIESLTKEQAIEIYKLWYWEQPGWYKINDCSVAAVCFDAGVNHGTVVAGKFMQRALNTLSKQGQKPLLVDGWVGDKTLERMNEMLPNEADAIICAFNGERYAYYKAIVDADESQRRFIRGWMERLEVPLGDKICTS